MATLGFTSTKIPHNPISKITCFSKPYKFSFPFSLKPSKTHLNPHPFLSNTITKLSVSTQEEDESEVEIEEKSDKEDGPSVEMRYLDPETDPESIVEWELDFCSRPVLDIRGNKLWELLVCDDSLSLKFAKYFPDNEINSITLKDAILSITEDLGVPLPKKIRVFRPQTMTVITNACKELGINPIQSKECLSLLLWLEEVNETVYTHHPGFQMRPLLALDDPFPLELPDNHFGKKGYDRSCDSDKAIKKRKEQAVEKQKLLNGRAAEQTVVVVNPKPSKGLTSKLIDYFENLVVKLMYNSSKPLHYLSGNFAPVVDETSPVTNLPVRGHLPDCLNGEFVRVGPNPKFAPVAGYHWFDGDGMIHGIRFKDGRASYVCRYVRTSRIKQEEFFGGTKFAKLGDLKGLFGLLMVGIEMLREKTKVLDLLYGNGTGNTNLIYHHGKLLALQETDKPYVVKVLEDGDLETIGLLDYGKRLNHPFTAHPKVDPFTGEMFTFGYSHEPPYVTYRVIAKDGFMHDPIPIAISDPIMMHDFAITENYAVFMDLPLHFRPKEMVTEKKLVYMFDATRKARFGILPRYEKDDHLIKWFELPNCFIFHNANAWEEEDEIVLITCRLQNPDLEMFTGIVKEESENFTTELYEMRFNMKTGVALQKKLSAPTIDFPRVNESYIGRKQQYVYGTILENIAKVKAVVKFDLQAKPVPGKERVEVGGNVKGIFDLGHGRFGSEAIFVPRKPGTTSEEDDGYLIFFAHDENKGKSSVTIIDAKTMADDPVAVVELPHRVPYGLHALFVSEERLQEQAKL